VTIGIAKHSHEQALSLFQSSHTFIREVTPGEQDLRLYVDKGESALPQILRLLDQAQIPLETIQMSLPTLNDVFLKKTGRLLRDLEVQ